MIAGIPEKGRKNMKKMIAWILAAVLGSCGLAAAGAESLTATAIAAEVNPERLVSVSVDAKITGCDGETCTLVLLVPERYRPDEILSLQPGDGIYTQGREVRIRTVTEKDGYLFLNEGDEDEVCLYESIDLNYWTMGTDEHTWTELATVTVPLPEQVLFLDDIDPATGEGLLNPTVHNKAEFLAMMDAEDDPGFDLYNVRVVFNDRGDLALIRRRYVPWE